MSKEFDGALVLLKLAENVDGYLEEGLEGDEVVGNGLGNDELGDSVLNLLERDL